MVNTTSILKLLIVILLLQMISIGQISIEKSASQGETIKRAMERIEKFYNENYFSKGFDKTEMSGTGYYPYYRMKWFYEQRADKNGEVPFLKRWDAYQLSKQDLLKSNHITAVPNWISLGPTNNGGRMISHAFDPVDPEIVWAGSAAGGLWRTTDGGDSWEPMTDYLPSIAIGAVAIKPDDPNVMFIGTGEPYGWIYMVDGIGILKSTDRGLTWEQTSLTYTQPQGVSCYDFAWDPQNTNVIYAACTNGLWKSDDEGANWVKLYTGRITAIEINKEDPSILYMSSQSEGVFKSTNHGTDWTSLSNGIKTGNSIGLTSLTLCDAYPNILYASIAGNDVDGKLVGLYKSNDEGENWEQLEAPEFFCYDPPYDYICQGWYNNVVKVSPFDSNYVFCNGINMYRTKNSGEDWDNPGGSLPNPYVHVDHHSIGFSPHNPQVIYDFNDGGVYKSTNGGNSWMEKNEGLVTMQFYSIASAMTDTNFISGGSQDNRTQRVHTDNGYTRWSAWWDGDGMITNIDHTNSKILYGEQQFGGHGKSTTGGNTKYTIMDGITELGTWSTPVIMDPINPLILFTTSEKKIYKTTNGGEPWFSVADIPDCKVLECDQIDPDIVYAAAYNFSSPTSYLWRSADGGESWDKASSPGWRVTDLKASPYEEGVLYATRNNKDGNAKVYKSTDYGESWTSISSNLPAVGSNAITVNPHFRDNLYLATDLGIYLSLDDGESWQEFNNNLPNVYTMDIHYHPADSTIRIGTFGRGVWKTKAVNPNNITSIKNNKEDFTKGFIVYQNYPNPFNPETIIRYELKQDGYVDIDIFNELGQKVVRLFSNYRTAGTHSIHWNGKNSNGLKVSSGNYFCRVSYAGFSKTVKMVLIR